MLITCDDRVGYLNLNVLIVDGAAQRPGYVRREVWSGSAGATISSPNDDVNAPKPGLGAGDGYLVVPAGDVLNGWKIGP